MLEAKVDRETLITKGEITMALQPDLLIVPFTAKQRCPHCTSIKWKRIGALSDSGETKEKFLLVRYQCGHCKKEFLAEEKSMSK